MSSDGVLSIGLGEKRGDADYSAVPTCLSDIFLGLTADAYGDDATSISTTTADLPGLGQPLDVKRLDVPETVCFRAISLRLCPPNFT